ncbi:hypothetical protein AAC387_Pa03g3758 [Persea americana]
MSEANAEAEAEALRLKSRAEKKYQTSLKSALKYARRSERLCPDLDGISQMVTTFEVLHGHRQSADWYSILQLRPFSHPNTISKQYKKLALLLHPANNPSPGADLAFEAIGLAFLTLSDKLRRQQYDITLRRSNLQTFWTACSTCRLYHQFDRRYLGQKLVCPSCKKTFSAVQVRPMDEDVDVDDDDDGVRVRSKAADRATTASPLKTTKRHSSNERSASASYRKGKAKVCNLDDSDDGGGGGGCDSRARVSSRASARARVTVNATVNSEKKTKGQSSNERRAASIRKGRIKGHNSADSDDDDEEEIRSSGTTRARAKAASEKSMRSRQSSNKKPTTPSRKGINKGGNKGRNLGKDDEEWVSGADVEDEERDDVLLLDWLPSERKSSQKRKMNGLEKPGSKKVERGREKTLAEMQLEMRRKLESKKVKKEVETEKSVAPVSMDSISMSVEDADFYDFDKDRVERSFKQGQVWAVYDDDDGMPRHYGLIEEVVSVNPFLLKMSWLDLQNSGDGVLISWEKLGFHISCGRFKVGRKVDIDSVNCFSHLVECERAAREIYRMYPKKGSVWALYAEEVVDGEWRSPGHRERRSYDIVVFLTSYSEMHGLSMAYLEKVEGFKTIFKRREIGCHAIRWLEKDDVRLFSHQIPARKISGEEASDLPKDCWELDPASLPSDMLRIGWVR